MTTRGWFTLAGTGAVSLAIVAGGVCWITSRNPSTEAPPAVAEAEVKTPFEPKGVAAGLALGDAKALAAFRDHLVAPIESGDSVPLAAGDLVDTCGMLDSAARGFANYGPLGRATLAGLAGIVLDRLAAEPAPEDWTAALEPIHAVLEPALRDGDVQVRTAALGSTAKLWGFIPGRPALPLEESRLASWKDAFHPRVAELLNDPEVQVRSAAVRNMATVPLDAMAVPAAVRVADISPEVRRQVLLAFAKRPAVLGEEAILARLHDDDPSIVLLAKYVLDQRGLTEPQIELGRLAFHPNPEIRKQVLGEVNGREDIDPVVWLVHLSRDPEEAVRVAALKVLGERKAQPEALQRLTEMALSDPSGSIRVQARKLLPPEAAAVLPPIDSDATVAMPPLPGSPALNPKAN